jgi:predicted DNA-binding protein YlxM (UPF0122 family)
MDYRVKITIRNNHILKAMEKQGYPSVSNFCRKFKLPVASVNSVIAGRYKPLLKNGKICPLVEDLLDYLNLSLEEAFTEKQLIGFYKNSFQIEMKESQLTSLMSPAKNTELLAMEHDVTNALHNLMNKVLSPREELLIRGHYFEKKSIKELGEEINLSGTGVDRAIKKGLFKLSRHYGVLAKSGIKEVFPKVGNTIFSEVKNDFGNFINLVKKRRKEKQNEHMER